MENFQESSAYSFGVINGIKQTLTKIAERINNMNIVIRGSARNELLALIEIVNEFPTIKEKGEFFLDPETGFPAFRWEPGHEIKLS